MANDPEDKGEQEEAKEASPGVGRFLYRLALAGVGGVVLAQEEISGLFHKRGSDGEDADSSGDPSEGSTEETDESPNRMEATIDGVLHTFNLPTRGDVEELTRKIDELADRVKALRAR